MWLDMKVRRNSLSCSQYQSDESCVRLRKRASLWRSERKVRAWIAPRRTRRASTCGSKSVFCTNSYAPAARAAPRIPGWSLPVSARGGKAECESLAPQRRHGFAERLRGDQLGLPREAGHAAAHQRGKVGVVLEQKDAHRVLDRLEFRSGLHGLPLYLRSSRRLARTDKPSPKCFRG